jgi:hypothetical protein
MVYAGIFACEIVARNGTVHSESTDMQLTGTACIRTRAQCLRGRQDITDVNSRLIAL